MNIFGKLSDIFKSINNRTKIDGIELDCKNIDDNQKPVPFPDEEKDNDITVFGTSICGDNTALQIEGGKIGLDVGPTSDKLNLPDHLFISHYHNDHFSNFPQIGCRSIKEGKDVDVYIGQDNPKVILNIIQKFEDLNPDNRLNIHYIKDGDRIQIDDDTHFEFFKTNHTKGSVGLSILKKNDDDELENYITYTGDINLAEEEMKKDKHLQESKNLIIESSYFGNEISDILYNGFRHSSFKEVDKFLEEREQELDSITYIHIPYSKEFIQSCIHIEEPLYKANAKNVGYIPTCVSGKRDPMIPAIRKRIK